ncbi:MAG: hypothetical protein ACLSGB_02020 [Dorea sp.]
MSEITTVVLDAMGGDNAPAAMIDGAIDAISKEKNVKVILVGIEDVIRKVWKARPQSEQIEIVRCDRSDRDGRAAGKCDTQEETVIHLCSQEWTAITAGKADAIVICCRKVLRRLLVGGRATRWQESKALTDPPLAPLSPDGEGVSLLIDCGANVDAQTGTSASVRPRSDPSIWRTFSELRIREWRIREHRERKKRRAMHWSKTHFHS